MKSQPQQLVDLLPDALHQRANARATHGRNITYSALLLLILILSTVHAHLLESRAAVHLTMLRNQANQLERNEQQVTEMRDEIDQLKYRMDRYQKVELPIDMSRVIAAIVDSMPEAAALDRIDIFAEQLRRSSASSWRTRSGNERLLTGEVSGFARSDLEIADFVGNLDRTRPFEDISLDLSRQRTVRDLPAREFRVSFFIDLNRTYEVVDGEKRATNALPDAVVSSPAGDLIATGARSGEQNHAD